MVFYDHLPFLPLSTHNVDSYTIYNRHKSIRLQDLSNLLYNYHLFLVKIHKVFMDYRGISYLNIFCNNDNFLLLSKDNQQGMLPNVNQKHNKDLVLHFHQEHFRIEYLILHFLKLLIIFNRN